MILKIYHKTAIDLIVSASANCQSRRIPGILPSAEPWGHWFAFQL